MSKQISTQKGLVFILGAIVVFGATFFIIDKTGIRLPSIGSSETKTESPAKATFSEVNKKIENIKVVAYPRKSTGQQFEYRFDVLNQSQTDFKGNVEILLYKDGSLKDKVSANSLSVKAISKESIITEPIYGEFNGFSYKLTVNGITINRDDIVDI